MTEEQLVQGADELRAEIEAAFCDAWRTLPDDVTVLAAGARIADAVLALPEVARLLAERDQAQAKVAAVRELEQNTTGLWPGHITSALRRALDGAS